MKTLRPYGARLLVALLLTLTAYNTSASSRSEAGAILTLCVPGINGWTLCVPGINGSSSVTYGGGGKVFYPSGSVPLRPDKGEGGALADLASM